MVSMRLDKPVKDRHYNKPVKDRHYNKPVKDRHYNKPVKDRRRSRTGRPWHIPAHTSRFFTQDPSSPAFFSIGTIVACFIASTRDRAAPNQRPPIPSTKKYQGGYHET
jgi:hypothetical protein